MTASAEAAQERSLRSEVSGISLEDIKVHRDGNWLRITLKSHQEEHLTAYLDLLEKGRKLKLTNPVKIGGVEPDRYWMVWVLCENCHRMTMPPGFKLGGQG